MSRRGAGLQGQRISTARRRTDILKHISGQASARKGDGFSVEWTTVTQKPSGKIKSARHIVAFAPAARPGIYWPVQGNRPGRTSPLEPLKGDPQVRARVAGKTMSVHATVITKDGGVEMRTYDHSLASGGMGPVSTRTRYAQQSEDLRTKLEIRDAPSGTAGRRTDILREFVQDGHPRHAD